ncbi:MAG: MBL fold metallo-hydrolase [Deltaproteobacteria bacterium]|nr:MBL fold metallo-hydrolase [Deltaproteobacteria bacterium]
MTGNIQKEQCHERASYLSWWGFKPQEIPYLLLTHVHIDHSGRIPKLVKDGFHGKIFATRPTCELCRILFMEVKISYTNIGT